MTTGYSHRRYAEALGEWGWPRHLRESGGWVLERPIPGVTDRDATGCYPLFACPDWSGLPRDLGAVGQGWVSVTVVTDPFAGLGAEQLREAFPDRVRPYKEHFVVELGQPPEAFAHPHHLRNARKAAAAVRVRFGGPTPGLLAEWVRLYGELVARHDVRGLAAFSERSFARQFEVPGLVVEWAEAGGEVAGMLLWYVAGERAYYHLGAYSEAGYASRCSFALFHAAVGHFAAAGLRYLALGAGVGAANDGSDGLTRFKRGWATGTRPTYLCGRVFDPDRYRAVRDALGQPESDYFPEYRRGEFR